MANKINLSIPKELEKKIKERIKGTNFKSIPDYILFILQQLTSEEQGEEKQFYTEEEEADIRGNPELRLDKKEKKREGYSEEEEAELRKELEDLGYM